MTYQSFGSIGFDLHKIIFASLLLLSSGYYNQNSFVNITHEIFFKDIIISSEESKFVKELDLISIKEYAYVSFDNHLFLMSSTFNPLFENSCIIFSSIH
jgi:hypothetical protein